MKNTALTEVQKIWDSFSADKDWKDHSDDYSAYKNMLLAFQPGPGYYWLLNTRTAQIEMMSDEVTAVLGYQPNEMTFPFMLSLVHPEDTPYILNFENALSFFFSGLPFEKRFVYKIQYDFRMQRHDGRYVRILNQMLMVGFNTADNCIRTFGIQSDISHLKTENKPVLSFICIDNSSPSYLDIDVKQVYKPVKSFFTAREKEILLLMLNGNVSKEISDLLNISKHTVDTHRKKILDKTNSRSIPEMVKKAIVNGWI